MVICGTCNLFSSSWREGNSALTPLIGLRNVQPDEGRGTFNRFSSRVKTGFLSFDSMATHQSPHGHASISKASAGRVSRHTP